MTPHTENIGPRAQLAVLLGNAPPLPPLDNIAEGCATPRREVSRKRVHPKPKWMDPAHLNELGEDEKEHLLELNKRYATGLLGSNLRIIFEPGRGKPVKFLSVRDAALRESARIFFEEGAKGSIKKVKAFDRWMEWIGHRDFEEIKFAPGDNDPNIYNLFRGWPIKPTKGDWSLLRDHIFHVICNGDTEQFIWFMTWLAHIFQFPADKRSVAVVIRGEKGTGKSKVFDFIQALMPDYFFKVADGRRALSNFNAHCEQTLLLLMEEAFWAGDQANESILKDLITSPSISIERKGVNQYMATNYMRVAMISNERWVVPAGGRERRFAVFDCSSDHRNDIPYFKQMTEQMENGGLEAMLHELLHWRPATDWNVLFTPPVTSGLGEQVIESLRGIDRFMFDLLAGGEYECDGLDEGRLFLSEDQPTPVSFRDLRAAARDYLADGFTGQKAANYNLVERKAAEWFGAKVIKVAGKVNQQRRIEFPPLGQCRSHVRETKGIEIQAPNSQTGD